MINYVVIIALSKDLGKVVTLIKDKGPEHLIGKHCFPGGKIEAGEDAVNAAAREFQEETGVPLDPLKLKRVSYVRGENYSISAFTGVLTDISKVRTMESEVVQVLDIQAAFNDSNPGKYCPEFVDWTSAAISLNRSPAVA